MSDALPPHTPLNGRCQRDGDEWPCTAMLAAGYRPTPGEAYRDRMDKPIELTPTGEAALMGVLLQGKIKELWDWVNEQISGIQRSSSNEISYGALRGFSAVRRKMIELGLEPKE